MGFHPKFHLLDIDSLESIRTFKTFISETYQGIDVLVNNAAIAFKVSFLNSEIHESEETIICDNTLQVNATEPFAVQARETIKTNYFGFLNVCTELFPLLRPHARVVNVSGTRGHLSSIPSKKLRDTFSSSSLTETQLTVLLNSFVE